MVWFCQLMFDFMDHISASQTQICRMVSTLFFIVSSFVRFLRFSRPCDTLCMTWNNLWLQQKHKAQYVTWFVHSPVKKKQSKLELCYATPLVCCQINSFSFEFYSSLVTNVNMDQSRRQFCLIEELLQSHQYHNSWSKNHIVILHVVEYIIFISK